MRAITHLMASFVLGSAALAAADVPVSRIIDDDGPARGVRTLDLDERWRVGGEDEDVIFGRIMDVKRGVDGNVYILDNQMCHVVVISAEGEFLREISREGDGPGELRQPIGIVFPTPEMLGVGTGFPGKLVCLDLEGVPVTTHYPIGEPAEGNIGIMINVQFVDGVLAASGGRIVFEGPDNSFTSRFLAVGDGDLGTFHRILEKRTPLDPTGRRFVERDAYYVDRSYALGPGGIVYAPLNRDAYEISVFDRAGELLRVFGRDERPRRRTREEMDEVGPIINVNGNPDDRDWDIAEHDEAVSRILYDHDADRIWVLTPNGSNDQPEGVLEAWDVFSPEGEYLERVIVPLGHEIDDGNCYLVGGGLLVVVRGTGSIFGEGDGAEGDEAPEEVEPLEVICYEMR